MENPWDFNTTKVSPNKLYILKFQLISEIAMGGPLSGNYVLEIDNKKITLPGSYGGPVIWNNFSSKVAIPKWTDNRLQKISIIDIKKKKLLTSKRTFKVLELKKFEGNIIKGIDSPIYKALEFEFNLGEENFDEKNI